MQRGALVSADYRKPSRVSVGQFLRILNALVQVSQILLVIGKTMQSLDRGVGRGGHGALLACGLTAIRLGARLSGIRLTRRWLTHCWRVAALFGLVGRDLLLQRCMLFD